MPPYDFELFDDDDPWARIVPQEGDVIFGPGGSVRRVGDAPKRRAHPPANNPSTEVVCKMSSIEAAQERLKAALVEFAGLQALQDRFQGKQPPIGTVLRWLKTFDGRSGEMVIEGLDGRLDADRKLTFNMKAPQQYTYVAFRAPDGNWYSTSQRGVAKFEWDDLLKQIGDNYCEIASGWIEVPAPEKLAEEAMDPTAWAAALFGKKDAPQSPGSQAESSEG